jgi:RimJ/RimL family protein N-acetyltransferase
MSLTFDAMDEASARAIATWRYDAPYDLYNLDADDLPGAVQAFMDPRNAYYVMVDGLEGLVAYCCFGPDAMVPGGDYGAPGLDIGLGVRPDLTGQGRGLAFVSSVLAFARRTFAPEAFRVTIAEFNKRALRVWEKAGFRAVQTFLRDPDGRCFVVLTKREADNAQHAVHSSKCGIVYD